MIRRRTGCQLPEVSEKVYLFCEAVTPPKVPCEKGCRRWLESEEGAGDLGLAKGERETTYQIIQNHQNYCVRTFKVKENLLNKKVSTKCR